MKSIILKATDCAGDVSSHAKATQAKGRRKVWDEEECCDQHEQMKFDGKKNKNETDVLNDLIEVTTPRHPLEAAEDGNDRRVLRELKGSGKASWP